MKQLFLRCSIALLIAALAGIGAIASGPVVAQDATPTATAQLPERPLGEQITWLVDYINMPAAEAETVDLTTKFSPGVLADVPADQLAAIIGTLRDQLAPVTLDTATLVTTEDLPPTTANFVLVGRDGTRQPVSLSVAPDTGLISSIWFASQLAPAPTSEATLTAIPTGTATVAPTETATVVPTETATELPTETPTTVPSETPTTVPTETPTEVPTETPTVAPTETATDIPTETPTLVPTETATEIPTETPTAIPTETPTDIPTETATEVPTETPTEIPTETATAVPSETATLVPTETPTTVPTETATDIPTDMPTELPTETATLVPTQTAAPTETETSVPTATETELPTETATEVPTEEATEVATQTATEAATEIASPMASPEAVSPDASPEAASPVASPDASPFGDSALGEQAAWTWSTLNTGGEPVAASEIEAHVSPELLEVASAEQIAAGLVDLQEAYGPFTLDPDSIVMTANEPPTNMRYAIAGADGTTFDVSLSIDPETGLLTGYLISPVGSNATPVAMAPLPAGIADSEISFSSGDDTIFGSFMTPEDFSADGSSPAALIISGSGSTDRDGNSSGLPLGTNRNLAVTLAADGIPSLRYDKLGSGQTGLGTQTDVSTIDYELFLQEARDAAAFLAEQPGVDPSKLILVGHSEGALFALALADELTKAGRPPAGLILVAPLSIRYLDLLDEQLSGQIKAALDSGEFTEDQASKVSTELAAIIESLRTTGDLPGSIEDAGLAQIFTPANIAFLAQIDAVDPGELAAGLPADMPVLVLLGAKDAQVTGNQVRHLLDGFNSAGNANVTFVALPKADHTLRIIEGEADPSVDYANPDLEFSPQAVSAIEAFLSEHSLVLELGRKTARAKHFIETTTGSRNGSPFSLKVA